MKVSAWASGRHAPNGIGYGLKVSVVDRDQNFSRTAISVKLRLPGVIEPVVVNTAKKSFWNGTCRELISKEIRDWFWANGYAPWPPGKPPKFELTPLGGGEYRVTPLGAAG